MTENGHERLRLVPLDAVRTVAVLDTLEARRRPA